jgi:dGTPase
VNHLVDDLVRRTAENIRAAKIQNLDDVRNHPSRLAAFSKQTRQELSGLRRHLFQNLYHSPEVGRANEAAARMISELFDYLLQNPENLGRKARNRIERDGLHRSIGDYISGMTDRYLSLQHRQLLGSS